MPSALAGLFSKLALEYCSPPSPLAIAQCGVSRFSSNCHARKRRKLYRTRPDRSGRARQSVYDKRNDSAA